MGRFTSVDPHAEKYYSISPYAYCGNNPINRIDPSGMDTIDVANNGETTVRTGGDNDILNVTNNKGKVVSKVYDKGTISVQSFDLEDADGKKTGETYTYLQVNGDENAESVYNFVAGMTADMRNTNVEWSLSKFNFANGNYISTSHVWGSDASASHVINSFENKGFSLLSHTHNHPFASFHPSGLWGPQLIPGTNQYTEGDIGFAKNVTNATQAKFGTTPQFYIFNHLTNKSIPYSAKSKPADFGLK